MAVQVVTRELIVCSRCAFGKQALANHKRVFAMEDRYYEIVLCDKHVEMFDRDENVWVMLADEIDNPYAAGDANQGGTFFDASHLDEARRVRELKEVAAVKERERAAAAERERAEHAKLTEAHARRVIPGSMKWKITQHAYQRMVQRAVAVFDVLEAAARPEQTYYQPHKGEYVAIHQRGHCRIAVNERDHEIITVIDRDAKLDEALDDSPLAAAAH